MKIENSKGQVVLYKNRLEVRLDKETVCLTQKQMSELFDIERSVITKHLSNIFATNELEEKRNVQKMHIPFSDKPVSFYNLDVIISVGYRVNSKRGTQFRIWATDVLRQHLVDGYTLNKKRLMAQEGKIRTLQNPDFKPVEFDGFKKLAGFNSFTLTPKQWIEKIGVIG